MTARPPPAPLPQALDVVEFAKARTAEMRATLDILHTRNGVRRVVRLRRVKQIAKI